MILLRLLRHFVAALVPFSHGRHGDSTKRGELAIRSCHHPTIIKSDVICESLGQPEESSVHLEVKICVVALCFGRESFCSWIPLELAFVIQLLSLVTCAQNAFGALRWCQEASAKSSIARDEESDWFSSLLLVTHDCIISHEKPILNSFVCFYLTVAKDNLLETTMMVDSPILPAAPHQPSGMDRLDAAQALLGASEPIILETVHEQEPVVARRSRSGSVGLDELAAIAVGSMEQSNSISQSSSDDDDSEAMPPPPPRGGRPRSCSNPEGMEKWGNNNNNERRHFVLPSSILEEELAEASALAEAHEARFKSSLPIKKRGFDQVEDTYGTSPDSVTSPIMLSAGNDDSYLLDEQDVEPEELLRRARSRLLEDLSEGSLKGEKGVLTLPHSLSKYKEVRFMIAVYRFTNAQQCHSHSLCSSTDLQ